MIRKECHCHNWFFLLKWLSDQSECSYQTLEDDLWQCQSEVYDSDQTQNMSTNKSQIHQFLFQVSSINEWTELKQKCEDCCSAKSNIQQNAKSINR